MKTLTIVVIVRLFEQWRRDAENRMRAVSVERLVLNVFVGENGVRFVVPLPALSGARSVSQTRPSHLLWFSKKPFVESYGRLLACFAECGNICTVKKFWANAVLADAVPLLEGSWSQQQKPLSHRGTKGPMPDGSSKSK